MPAVLVLGVMAPVELLMESPAGEALYVPPVYAPEPVRVTDWVAVTDMQKGVPAYEIVAAGRAVIVMVLVAVTWAQPPAAAMVLVTV